MRIQFPLILAGVLTLAPVAAQAATGGAYADFSTISLGSSSIPRLTGLSMGGYAEGHPKRFSNLLDLGVDARITGGSATTNGVWYMYGALLIGPEVSFKTHITSLRPYAEVLVGAAQMTTQYPDTSLNINSQNNVSNNYGQVSFIGGTDINLLPHLAWRALELNYGKFNGISSTTISTGLVLRLP